MGGRPRTWSCKPAQARWQGQAGRRCHWIGQFATVSLSCPCFYNFNRTISSAVPFRRSGFSKTAHPWL